MGERETLQLSRGETPFPVAIAQANTDTDHGPNRAGVRIQPQVVKARSRNEAAQLRRDWKRIEEIVVTFCT